MTEEKKVVEEECRVILITTEGKEVYVEYEVDPDIDDFYLEGLQKSLENNEVSNCNEATITIGGITIDEIDFKKIIGIRWN